MLKFGSRAIGPQLPPLIIAEMSGNHNQSLERALALVDAAADAGAHAIKLQTYTPDTMTLNLDAPGFRIEDPDSLWHGRTLYDLYREAHTPWEWHAPIFARARERGIECLSTPFDDTAVEFLEQFDPPAYKIASFEITDLPLIERVAQTGRTMIVSTGMASVDEIADAVKTARSHGCKDIVLLKCTSTYPASPQDSNVVTVADMRERFGAETGLSDHTLGIGAAVAAVALGAVLVEKHFTLARADGGVDSVFSMEPGELRSLVAETHRAWLARGSVQYGAGPSEQKSLAYRRSLYVSRDIRRGEIFTRENVRIVRPGYGLAPRHFSEVLGKAAAADIRRGTAVTWDVVAGGREE